MHFDEDLGTWDVPPDQQFDRETGRVTVTTTDFSPIAVLDEREQSRVWTMREPRVDDDGVRVVPVDVAIALDSSGSMRKNDPEDKRKAAANALIDRLMSNDRAAAVDFDDNAVVIAPMTYDLSAVKQAIALQVDRARGRPTSAPASGSR